jgi:hypothetical protein
MRFTNASKLLSTRCRRSAAREGIETSLRPALKKSFPRLPILDKEEIRVKFKKDIIIRSNFVNGSKILG